MAYGDGSAAEEAALFNIFDLMRAAPGGVGMDAVARQFGLSQEQAQRTFAALMPAFALGLERNAADPSAFANLMRLMSGPFAAQAPAQPQAQGGEALGQLFGSPELTRRIAEQAAHWSGVSAQVVQQMMPIFAAALVGSLAKFSEIMRTQAAGESAAAAARPASDPYSAWTDVMRAFMSGAAGAATPLSTSPNAPWADLLRMMAPDASEPAAPRPPPEAQPAKDSGPPRAESMEAAWSQAMASGREAQAQYLASLQNIFDQFWGAGPDRR
jgi:hypothetical protein